MKSVRRRKWRVRSVAWRDHSKLITLSSRRKIEINRFACVTKGDRVFVSDMTHAPVLEVACRNGIATVLPGFSCIEKLQLGSGQLKVRVKEITEPFELESYLNLQAYHYRNEQFAGRHVPLVAVAELESGPQVLGYIELATSLFMNKPRTRLLDSPFRAAQGDVAWKRWDLAAARSFTNVIVRIARCVVHPEYRGVGLGIALTNSAIRFSAKHWQVGGLKPLFVEITADMLKFVPFVASAGMVYLGETEGNLGRVAKDMSYLLKNAKRINAKEILPRGGGGIVAVQKRYLKRAAAILESKDISRADFAHQLAAIASSLSPEEYFALHGVLRLPKPTYMAGITPKSKAFLKRRIRDLAIVQPEFRSVISPVEPLKKSIVVKSLTAPVRTAVEL